jgi:RNA polymerase sigma factor (sigma-70 family)
VCAKRENDRGGGGGVVEFNSSTNEELAGIGGRSAELLRRWQDDGDREALDELLRIEIAVLKSKIRRQGGSPAQSGASISDLAQDAVMRMLAVEPAPRFENTRAMRGYLWTAAWRLLISRLRKRDGALGRLDSAHTGAVDDALVTTGGMKSVEDSDRSVALDVALQLLATEEQQILALAYFRELGLEGAARELGISKEAAAIVMERARKSLARKLAKWTEVIG